LVGGRLRRANGAAGAPAVLLALAHTARSPSVSIRRAEPSSHKTQLPPPLARQSPVPTKPRSGRQGVTDLLADLLHGVLLELADALGGDAVDVGQFVQGGLLLGQPAAPQDILGALVQRRHGQLQAAGGVIFPVALLE